MMTVAQFDSAQFDYEANPELFLGRSGGGPLWVVWDTNILITYLKYGEALWGDSELLATDHEHDEVEALGALINLWVWRDIRWRVLERTLTDAQHQLSQSKYERSLSAMEEIAAALALSGREWDEPPPPPLTDPIPPVVLERLPHRGADRELVDLAQREGMHVLLTNDRRLANKAPLVAQYGLVLARPTGLLDLLAMSDDLGMLSTSPAAVPGLFLDTQRISHLIAALQLS